jgi:hypothetical protein
MVRGDPLLVGQLRNYTQAAELAVYPLAREEDCLFGLLILELLTLYFLRRLFDRRKISSAIFEKTRFWEAYFSKIYDFVIAIIYCKATRYKFCLVHISNPKRSKILVESCRRSQEIREATLGALKIPSRRAILEASTINWYLSLTTAFLSLRFRNLLYCATTYSFIYVEIDLLLFFYLFSVSTSPSF